jgi:hypothetical protein
MVDADVIEVRRSPGRPRSAEADEAILEAAVEIFAEVGLEGLTVEGSPPVRESARPPSTAVTPARSTSSSRRPAASPADPSCRPTRARRAAISAS